MTQLELQLITRYVGSRIIETITKVCVGVDTGVFTGFYVYTDDMTHSYAGEYYPDSTIQFWRSDGPIIRK